MDPTIIALTLGTQAMRLWADFMEKASKGELTEADMADMESRLQSHIAGFQALLDAHKA